MAFKGFVAFLVTFLTHVTFIFFSPYFWGAPWAVLVQRGKEKRQDMARLSAAAGAAVLRAAWMRVPQEKFPSDLAIGVREMVGTGGGGLSGNGTTKAFVDVSGPQAHGEQAERRNQKTAVHTEKLIPICDSQLEGADGLGRRNEINHDKEVGRAVSQGALAFMPFGIVLVRVRVRCYRFG